MTLYRCSPSTLLVALIALAAVVALALRDSPLPQSAIAVNDRGRITPLAQLPTDLLRSYAELPALEQEYRAAVQRLQGAALAPAQVNELLERAFPLQRRLAALPVLALALPGRYDSSQWYELTGLLLERYDARSGGYSPVANFSAYGDDSVAAVRDALLQGDAAGLQRAGAALQHAYGALRRDPAYAHILPSEGQLRAELFYRSFAWITALTALYLAAAAAAALRPAYGDGLWLAAWLLHSALLALRVYILGRPPVSNMAETALFVPWIAATAAWLRPAPPQQSAALLGCCCLVAAAVLLLLGWSGADAGLALLPPVLASQYWLTVHVLMVVSSYAFFLIAFAVGHRLLLCPPLTDNMTLQRTLYLSAVTGLLLLMAGTLLGGVWAAQSWGRFWDWDPKESWAFITCCWYLLLVHGHRYGLIAARGLALGAVAGGWVVGFTWYGVNYILGAGLHSYGFGQGGAWWFAGACAGDAALLTFYWTKKRLAC